MGHSYTGLSAVKGSQMTEEAEFNLAELEDGHSALDHVGIARKEENGIELAICERINLLAAKVQANDSNSDIPLDAEHPANYGKAFKP